MSEPVSLENLGAVVAGDHAALLPAAATAGAQVRSTATAIAERLPDLSDLRPRAVVVIAEGRAAHDAEIAVALLGSDCPTPVLVRAELPVWVGALDVVLVLESGSLTEAATAAVSRRRGATVLARAAARGQVAEAVADAVYPPAIGVPEALAGPGRLVFLLGAFSALGLLRPALDDEAVETVAELLDTEAIACAPQTDAFVNPALTLAQQLVGHDIVLAGMGALSRSLAGHAATALGELGGAAALAIGAMELAQTAALMARMATPRDIFADPFDDNGPVPAPLRPVLMRAGSSQDERVAQLAAARFRALRAALPSAAVLDGPEFSLSAPVTGLPEQPVRPEPTGWVRDWAAVALMTLRLDFAAVYLGIGRGQVAPLDGPAGLGTHDAGRSLLEPDTVVASYRAEEDVDRWN